jgi:hypothetical protein
METLSTYLIVLFALTTLITILIFLRAASWSKTVMAIIAGWIIMQSIISLNGFYLVSDTVPPRFVLLLGPPTLSIIFLFLTKKGRRFIDSLSIRWLTILHSIRIPVEFILYGLFLHKLIPQIMTFEGSNPDIISGITAPIIYYLVFIRQKLSKRVLLFWNIICLVFLVNIVTIAILSAPFTFQRFAFDQPAIGVLHFPFILLPCCIVPLVLLSHLASIRQLVIEIRKAGTGKTILSRSY